MNYSASSTDESIEPNAFGGFASGTASGIRSRRYHSLLLTKTKSPAGRLVLVNGFDAQVEFDGETCWLTSQHYAPDVIHPDGASRIIKFESTPWPCWSFKLTEDLASPGIFEWDLNGHSAVLALVAQGGQSLLSDGTSEADFTRLRATELNLRRLDNVNRE
jgi:glycogen debranching enzyme